MWNSILNLMGGAYAMASMYLKVDPKKKEVELLTKAMEVAQRNADHWATLEESAGWLLSQGGFEKLTPLEADAVVYRHMRETAEGKIKSAEARLKMLMVQVEEEEVKRKEEKEKQREADLEADRRREAAEQEEFVRLQHAFENTKDRLEVASAEKIDLVMRNGVLMEENEALKARLKAAEALVVEALNVDSTKNLSGEQAQAGGLKGMLWEERREKEDLKRQLEAAVSRNVELAGRNVDLVKEIKDHANKLLEQKALNVDFERDLSDALEEVNDLKGKLKEKEGLNGQLKAALSRNIDLAGRNAALAGEIDAGVRQLQEENEALKAKLEAAAAKHVDLTRRNSTLAVDLSSYARQLQEQRDENATLKQRVDRLMKSISKHEDDL